MKPLNPKQVAQLHDHLLRTGTDAALIDELIDHLACEVEYYLWIGLPFESAMDKALLEANAGVVEALRQTYQREMSLSGTRLDLASKDDIVFEFRNKAYGAYALRQAYPKNLLNATIMTLSLCMLLMAAMQMVGHGTFSYFSPWGAVWLTGLAGITFVSFNWYLYHERPQPLRLN